VKLEDRQEFDIGLTFEDTAPRTGDTTKQPTTHYTFEVAEQDLSSKGEDIGGVTYEIDAPQP
jgi:hypothetical protein